MEGNGKNLNEALQAALASRSPRFFRVSQGSARGRTGPEDTGRFADNLVVLQECALLFGEKLEMSAVSHAVYYEGDETVGFCFDPNSSSQNHDVAGAIVNRRMPMHEFISSVREHINS